MLHIQKYLVIASCWFLLSSLGINTAFSQSTPPEKNWNFLAEPYLMFPYMDGETSIGESLLLPVEADPGDIFSKLQMAAMLYLEAQTVKWSITSDIVYMKLNQEVTPGIIIHEGSVTAKQFIWETAGLYRLTPFLEVGIGGRLNNVKTETDIWVNVFPIGIEQVIRSGNKTWFDPLLISRLTTNIKDKWLFQFRGDLGGFGVGSNFTWQLQGYAAYRFSKIFLLSAGYRFLSIDYSSGEGTKEFIFNINEFGPVIRFGFNF